MAVWAFPNKGEKFASKYRLVSKLKTTQDLIIFHAIEIAFDRDVTLKIIRDISDDNAFSSFQSKSQSFSKLQAPFTASLLSFGRCEGFLYLALEFVEGEDLRSFLHPNPAATIEQTVNIFRQVLFSLREAHGQGIVHGDLQLKNIMLVTTDDADLSIKIRDFKIINFSEGGQTSPNEEVNENNDIKMLGLILVALLKGHLQHNPDLGSVIAPIPLKRIISKMLAEDANYKNVDDILADLGSPSLLDVIAPKKISTKKTYTVGLALGVFIFAPLSWTSLQLFSESIPKTSDSEAIISRVAPVKTGTRRVQVQPSNDANKKVSGSVNRGVIVQTSELKIVKSPTNPKKIKPKTPPTKNIVNLSKTDDIEVVEKVKTEPVILEKKKTKHPRLQPQKFSARRALKPITKKKKVSKKKKAIAKKKPIRKSLPSKLKPKKSAPLSF